jgi:soluble lytic murein transglycosylase-like protein
MILIVSFASNLDSQKLKPVLDENPVIAKVMSFQPISNLDIQKLKPVLDEKPMIAKVISSQPIEEGYTAAKIEHGLLPVKGNKKERLFHPIIIQTAICYQVDPALVKAIIMAESGFNPRAISKKGAKGLMQLMPETAKELNVEDIFNPQQNIDGGVRYFKKLVNQFNGDLKLALAAYNAGSKTVRQYKGVPPFKATQHYIKKVFEYYQLYKNQMTEEVDRA